MRTWHLRTWPLIIRWARSDIRHVHGNFWYTSLGSTCTCHYLIVGTNASQSASPSKLNIWFASSPIVLHWEGDNSFIRRRPPNHQDMLLLFLVGAMTSSRACYSHLGPWPKLENAPKMWRGVWRCPRTSSSMATTLGVLQGGPTQVGGPNQVDFESVSESRSSLH